jgi:hypothetical protein
MTDTTQDDDALPQKKQDETLEAMSETLDLNMKLQHILNQIVTQISTAATKPQTETNIIFSAGTLVPLSAPDEDGRFDAAIL